MLDTISHPQHVSGPERFDRRINVRPRPSFGLESLRNRKWLLVAGPLACLAIAVLLLAWRPTTYTASSQLLVYIRQILTGQEQAILPGRADLAMVQNQIELIRSGNVLAKVIGDQKLTKDPEFLNDLQSSSERTKGDPAHAAAEAKAVSSAYHAVLRAMNSKLGVQQLGTSHMVVVSFKASSPEKAASIVNSVVQTYLQELARASDAASSKASILREIHQSLGPSAQVLSEAEPPVRADGPPAALVLMAAALFGLSAAAAVAVLLDVFDDTIRSPHQMEYVLGLECLGVVPRFPGPGAGSEDTAHRLIASKSPLLRRALAVMQDVSSGEPRTIGVTSVLPSEGVTTLAIALAVAAAASGKHVLLIDAVPENPALSRWVARASRAPCEPATGRAAEALDGIVQVEAALHVLPLAEQLEGEPRLMRRGWLEEILGAADGSYDLVIVDLPSLVAGAQVRGAARSLDGFLLVVKWGATQSELVRQAFESAGQARHKFIGTILNMAEEEKMKRYGYERPAEMRNLTAS